MTANILVATPKTAIGELLRLSLEESGKHRVRLAQTPGEVQAASGRMAFDLAILDAALGDHSLGPLAQTLRSANSSLRLVVIPPEGDPARLETVGLDPDALLSLPFYAPDLLETVSALLAVAGGRTAAASTEGGAAPILGDQEEVTRLLSSLLPQAAARAILLVRSRVMWASAGTLDTGDVQELAGILGRFWDEHDPSDLARYARLGKGGEVLLYATPLAVETLLALAFEPSAPLMRVRGQVSLVAGALRRAQTPASPPHEDDVGGEETGPAHVEAANPPLVNAGPPLPGMKVTEEELAELLSTPSPTGKDAEDLLLALEEAGKGPALPEAALPMEPLAGTEARKAATENQLSLDDYESPEVSLTDLLAAMPPPDPQERSLAPGSEWIEGGEKEAEDEGFLFPWEMETQAINLGIQPASPAPSDTAAEGTIPILRPPAAGEADLAAGSDEETRRIPGPAVPTQRISPPAAAEAEVLQPLPPVPDLWQQAEELETPPTEFASLSYTCLLLPRLPNHLLTGRLARKLAEWLKQICLAYGWRLEAHSVRPDYFQWTVQVSPVISPSSVVRLVRLQTSQRIFGAFGRYAAAIPSGDFWAPGYLIISGSQPPETGLIRDYIQQTRKRQGL